MFLDAISKVGTSTISIPITALTDTAGTISATIGVGIPGAATPHLAKLGLFNHAVAENISKNIFSSVGSTLTDQWMDASRAFSGIYPKGVGVGWHRIHGHHFITDAITAFKNPNLSVIDFYKHLATDVVTKNGLPILPEAAVRNLANVLNVSVNKVMPWVSFNILDIGASILAVHHAGSNVISVVNGSAEWGTGYAIDTFGIGALEIAGGITTQNPVLIAAGATDVACGTITAHDYYTQPFLCGVPVSDLLSSSLIGGGLATILGTAELLLSKKSMTKADRVKLLSERIGTGGFLSGLSVIAAPLSITTGFGITGFKLAKQASADTNEYIKAIPVKGYLSAEIDKYICDNFIDKNTMNTMMQYVFEADGESNNKMLNYLR